MKETYEAGPGQKVTITVQVEGLALADPALALTDSLEAVERKRQHLALDNADLREQLRCERDTNKDLLAQWKNDWNELNRLTGVIKRARTILRNKEVERESRMNASRSAVVLTEAIRGALSELDGLEWDEKEDEVAGE